MDISSLNVPRESALIIISYLPFEESWYAGFLLTKFNGYIIQLIWPELFNKKSVAFCQRQRSYRMEMHVHISTCTGTTQISLYMDIRRMKFKPDQIPSGS